MNKILTNDGRVNLAGPFHVYAKPTTISDAVVSELAANYRVITSGGQTLLGKETALDAAGCEVGYYTKTNQLADGTHPASWYSHKTDGSIRMDSKWGVYCMEPSNKSWQAFHLQTLQTTPPAWASAIFSDSAGEFSFTQGGNHAAKPKTKTPYTLAEWLSLVNHNLNAWQAALPTKRFLVNGLTANTVSVYTPTVGMIENAFKSSTGKLPSQADWTTQMNLLFDAQAKGWTPWVYVKLFTSDSTIWDAFRNLLVPSMLLADTGSLLFELGGSEGSPPPYVTGEYKHPLYQPNIGAPLLTAPQLSAYLQSSGLYKRDYVNGVVVVNPTSVPLKYQLDALNAVTVPAQSGAVYRSTVKVVTTTSWASV